MSEANETYEEATARRRLETAEEKARLEAKYGVGNAWTTDDLEKEFEVHFFSAPMIVCTRKTDGVKGSMLFQHSPRVYYNFVAR